MAIRNQLNQRPGVAAGIGLACVVLAVGAILLERRDAQATNGYSRAYFTVDDGATLFTDDINKEPPFDHDGKPAVRAMVFTCDGGKTQFVQYLQKIGSSGKAYAYAGAANAVSLLVKKPGSSNWISLADPKAASVCTSTNSSGRPEQVLP
jgi:hypothetical protein